MNKKRETQKQKSGDWEAKTNPEPVPIPFTPPVSGFPIKAKIKQISQDPDAEDRILLLFSIRKENMQGVPFDAEFLLHSKWDSAMGALTRDAVSWTAMAPSVEYVDNTKVTVQRFRPKDNVSPWRGCVAFTTIATAGPNPKVLSMSVHVEMDWQEFDDTSLMWILGMLARIPFSPTAS